MVGRLLTLAVVLALSATSALPAVRKPVSTLPADYIRARAAEIDGDAATASATLAALLAREPGNPSIAMRALRQGMLAGDEALAVRAARAIDAAGDLPSDIRLLLIVEATKARDWKGALAQIARIDGERGYGFLAPMLRAWIAVGSHEGDALALLDQARAFPLAAPYVGEQRALILLAQGHTEQAVAAFRGLDNRGIGSRPLQLRLKFADALARSGEKARALDLLEGPEAPLVAARASLSAGRRLPAPIDGTPGGIAILLLRVTSDLDAQRLTPIALTLARYATFIAPKDASGWLATADLLGRLKHPDQALAAIAHVAPDDPLAGVARSLKIGLLVGDGRNDAALAEARGGVARTKTDPVAWQRVGDVELEAGHPTPAAEAYARAIEIATTQRATPDTLWPLWLQHGSALDQAGDWAGAKASLQKALALAPDQAVVLNQLGYSQVARRDDVPAATAMIERASKLRPDDPAITDSLGWARYLGGDAPEAVTLLEKASAADPAEPTINEHLGDAYWTSGRVLEARYAWRAALVTATDKDRARIAAKIDSGLNAATAAP